MQGATRKLTVGGRANVRFGEVAKYITYTKFNKINSNSESFRGG